MNHTPLTRARPGGTLAAMRISPLFVALLGMILPAHAAPPRVKAFDRKAFTLESQTFTLENGLRLIVHENHAVPVVAVRLMYHVGSRNEQRGRTGFAHLFEHFFFNGSEHHPTGFREAMDDLGAVNRNGSTDTDVTRFQETVPVSALEKTLFLEADRMGFLAKQINQAMLERERGVVKNEKRQGENQPYGRVFNSAPERLYPAEHPYSWPTIGSMEDLDAAKLEDVHAWYRAYYGPQNCVLVLAGDVTPARALELVKKHFGDIPPGPPVTRATEWVPRLSAPIREEMEDRVPEARLYRFYHAPPLGGRDLERLELWASVLSGSQSARLDRRLVHELGIATEVAAFAWPGEIASSLVLIATVKEGVAPARVEAELDRVVAALLREGPSEAELARAKTRTLSGFARLIEDLDEVAEVLASDVTFHRDPLAHVARLERSVAATPADVRAAGRRWIDAPAYTLLVTPVPARRAAAAAIDRRSVPALGAPPDVGFPQVQRARLKNGLEVVLLERHGAPLVNLALVVDAGFAADAPGRPGIASLAVELLDRGTRRRDFYQIVDALDAVGARLAGRSSLDHSIVRLEALATGLRPALEIFAEVVLEPTFPEARLEKAKAQRLSRIAQEKVDPSDMARRLVPALLYGAGHPYAGPLTGSGDEKTIREVTREDLAAWHRAWFKPGSARLIVTGDTTLAAIVPELERVFAPWPAGRAPEKKIATVGRTAGKRVFLVDRPGAQQTLIAAAHVSEHEGKPADPAADVVMRGFGGMATSRLNRNLRLDKHWSYGARAFHLDARGQRPFLLMAPVQSDKTAEAITEVLKEVRDIAGRRPVRGDELASLMRTETSRLPGRFATLASLEDAALELVTYARPDDHFATYAARVRALDERALDEAARRLIRPDDLILVVIGDLAAIEPKVRALGLGEVTRLDADGRPVR